MPPRLQLDPGEFAKAMGVFKKLLKAKRPSGEMLLGFKDGLLTVENSGIASTIPAQGEWDGEARVSAVFVLTLVPQLRAQVPTELFVADGELQIRQGSTVWGQKCAWHAGVRPDDGLAFNAGLTEVVAFSLRHSEEEIERLGQRKAVDDARARFEKLVEAAAKALSPLDIFPSDLRPWLEEAIRGRDRQSDGR
jgi:hypothetical protein